MIICILAGGEGSRLWPLSTPLKPKQILKLDGNNSLIQNTYKLLQKVAKDIFIVSEKSHATEMLKQLNGFDKDRMIIEPCRKGTTNCTLLAARHIKNYFNNKKDDDRILFIHADHIFDDEKKFISSIKQAFSIKDKGVIIIGGKKPTYSGVKYGYVQTTKINNHLYKVIKFHEKPSLEVAKTLYKKPNYFWNEGFFLTSINDLVSNFKKINFEVSNDISKLFSLPNNKVEKFYTTLKSTPIEKSLMEKSKNVMLLPISFSWVDLGTYNSLCSVLGESKTNVVKGNNIYELENNNTFIYNTTKMNVGVIGLDNVAVVLSKNGLLVLNKDKENLVSEISKKIKH